MSQITGVNYVHYGQAADSSSIEVNQLKQIKGSWRSHKPPLSPSSAAHKGEKICVLSWLHRG